MAIKINSFGGPAVWFFRKHYSGLTSKIMLTYASKKYGKAIQEYIKYFMSQEHVPIFASCMIETVNRCNGSCEFCPANVKDESRPLKKMEDGMFYGIIQQLKDIGWKGKLYLSINNEPFIDSRILCFAQYAKENLPGIKTCLITNGTLLSVKKMDEMVGKIDEIVINDYSQHYSLSQPHRSIYWHVRKNARRFAGMDIVINRRYQKEILATRAGNAPNKPKKNNTVDAPCIYPFLDLLIFPDGQVGMCCNDCKEISHFGDVAEQPLKEIWENAKFRKLRLAMAGGGRSAYPFCKECDVVDAGSREAYIKSVMQTGGRTIGKENQNNPACLRHKAGGN